MSAEINTTAINLRVLSAVSAFVSKDETRYYLNGVCLEIDERSVTYIATDGHRLIAYRDELPPDADANRLLGTFIIPAAHCKPFKLDKEEDGRAAIFGNGRLTIAHDMTDVTFVPIDGTFPDWRKVIPREPVTGALAQYNLTLLATYKKFSDALGMSAPFVAQNGEGPALVWFAGRHDVIGSIMPMRVQDDLAREPQQWVRKGPTRDQADIEDAA